MLVRKQTSAWLCNPYFETQELHQIAMPCQRQLDDNIPMSNVQQLLELHYLYHKVVVGLQGEFVHAHLRTYVRQAFIDLGKSLRGTGNRVRNTGIAEKRILLNKIVLVPLRFSYLN